MEKNNIKKLNYTIFAVLAFCSLLFPIASIKNASEANTLTYNTVITDNISCINGCPGNYTTFKYFIDENKKETIPIEIATYINAEGNPSKYQVEVYTNLNRRDYATYYQDMSKIYEDNSYYKVYPMTYAGEVDNKYKFIAKINVSKCGTYRLTTRYKINSDSSNKSETLKDWHWQNDTKYDNVNQRDVAIVVSPKKALNLTVYEVNPWIVEAVGSNPNGDDRSTFEDFTNHDKDSFDPFNLDFVKSKLGFNTMWITPIFPITEVRLENENGNLIKNYSPGSPYSTKNYWSVNKMLSDKKTEEEALKEFKYMVNQAERKGLNIMLDVAFNHSGKDTVFGQGAADLGFVDKSKINDEVLKSRYDWATSRKDFTKPASGFSDIALYAPADRLGEHKWLDAGLDWYYGNYSSLGPKNNNDYNNAENEKDLYYTDLNPNNPDRKGVQEVWEYFAYIIPYWLKLTNNQIDGIRADFAQGLPPQAWEYIINKTRQQKWDFIFLAEVLDPSKILYRVNRNFDVITTVDHWLYRKSDLKMSQIMNSLENESKIYGSQAVLMHNGTSHDEEGNGNKYLMVSRYAMAASVYGVPMLYMSQPLGVSNKLDFERKWENIKPYWDNPEENVFDLYKKINLAKERNLALKSTQRYFLNRKNGGFNDEIFSVARWNKDNIILVFINLRDKLINPDAFNIPQEIGLKPGAEYQIYNIISDTPDKPLWESPRTASDIYKNGINVIFHYPNEIQYLSLKEVN